MELLTALVVVADDDYCSINRKSFKFYMCSLYGKWDSEATRHSHYHLPFNVTQTVKTKYNFSDSMYVSVLPLA